MNLTYERTEYFNGEPEKALEIAQNTFLPNGFEIVESNESFLEVAKRGFNVTSSKQKVNPIDIISNASISANEREITIQAKLGGIKKLAKFYLLFMIGMLTLFMVIFGIIFTQNNKNIFTLIPFICVITVTPFALTVPAAAIWFRVKAFEFLDTLMSNMLSVSKSRATYNHIERKKAIPILLLVLSVVGIIVIDVPLTFWFIKKMNPKIPVYEAIDSQTIEFITEQYKNTVTQANEMNLYASCQIYYVNDNFMNSNGGINYFKNRTDKAISEQVKLNLTSYLNQTLYDTSMQELDVEFVRDQQRADLYRIYFTPREPIESGETFYYLWSNDKPRSLGPNLNKKARLTMRNHPGSHILETFFLVLDKNLHLLPNNPPTASRQLDNFNVYWWTKEITQDENHVEEITISK